MRKIVIVGLILCILGLAYLILAVRYERNKSIALKYRLTQDTLSTLRVMILLTANDTNQLPPEQIKSLISWLKNGCEDKYFVEDMEKYNIHSNQIFDAWVEPIKYIIEDPAGKYLLISSGPNKRFENGKGDDMVEYIDLLGLINEK